ncbi:alpha/beta hydrolase family protein [Mesorhizobium sp. NPDC059054]|uniref:alpha/beta hydrolase family protein n=1 Tax=Mesorhizobium sp. NPDC059054 TaxID=3346711 RepID=UPI00369F17B1
MVAWYGIKWTRTVLYVGKTADWLRAPVAITAPGVDTFIWHPFEPVLLVFAGGRLLRIDPRKPQRTHWVDITPQGFRNWRIDKLPGHADAPLIVASNDRDPAYFDLFTVSQDGRSHAVLVENDGRTLGWLLDDQSVPLARIDRLRDTGTAILLRDGQDEPWRTLLTVEPDDTFSLIGAVERGAPLIAISDRGRDRTALVSVDPQSAEETVIADHPRVDVKDAVHLSKDAGRPDFVVFDDDHPRLRAFTPTGEAVDRLMLDGDNPVDLELLGRSRDSRFVTVARSWREKPFEYLLYDLESGTETELAKHPLHKHKDVFVETQAVSFTARDGLEIPAFLTLPSGVGQQNRPSIIVIHGGPAERQGWGYNPDLQLLANRGYAILSVNFRGSTGYGKSFRAAGYREVGKAMQDDIVDAANWLIAKGIADQRNLAVMGASYGGYAAALAMARDRGLFKVAIIENAITDLVHCMQNTPSAWGLHMEEVKRYFGDVDDPADLVEMRANSPLTRAKDITGPILILAGKQDQVVGVEHSIMFQRALKSLGKPVTAMYFADEGHIYAKWQTKLRRALAIERFLARNLGGRAGSFDIYGVAARYLR